jgi:hypothetical protein
VAVAAVAGGERRETPAGAPTEFDRDIEAAERLSAEHEERAEPAQESVPIWKQFPEAETEVGAEPKRRVRPCTRT